MLCPVLHNLSCCARMKLHSIFWTKKKQVHLWYTLHGCCPWSHHSGRCCRGVHRNQQPSWAILRVFVFIHHHSLPHHFWWLNLACRCWYSSPDAVWRCLGSTLPLLCSLTGITVSYQVGKLYGYSVPFYSYEFMWRQVQVFFFFFVMIAWNIFVEMCFSLAMLMLVVVYLQHEVASLRERDATWATTILPGWWHHGASVVCHKHKVTLNLPLALPWCN